MTQTDLTGRTLGGYRILRKLGQGGMAVVYKAHEESLDRVVALKVIAQHLSDNQQFITRFQREAKAAAQLSHPNIVQIYAIGEDDGVHYFSMEYVKGRSLAEIIDEEGFLTAGRALPIIAQAAEALAVAHEAGIVHRDIKPPNIMLDPSGRVKVADFGIAQMATETRMTQSGMLVGTPEFISPEQCHSEKLDGRSDIYSLGVTLYQLLSGRTPFQADTPASLVLQIVDGPIPRVGELNPTIPADVQAIVAKMMHIDRKQRFQSADDLLHALKGADTQPATTGTQVHPAPGVVAAGPPADSTVAIPAQGATAEETATPTEVMPTTAEEAATPTEVMPTTEPAAPTEAMPPTAAEATEVVPATAAPTEAVPDNAAPTVAGPATAAPAAAGPESGQTTVAEPAPTDAAPTSRPSPATEAYADDRNNRGALFGLAAMVLILITVIFVGWQFMGRSGADEPFDPTAEARPQALPEAPQENANNDATPATNSGDAAGEAAVGTQPAREPTGQEPSAGATEQGPAAETTEQGPAAEATQQPAATTQQPAATTQQPVPTAAPPPAFEEEPAFVPPPDNSIVADTSGEYEYAEQVHAWMEAGFGGQSFEIIDFPSSPYPSLQAAARFHVVTTARLVGTEQLAYFGNTQTQFTVSLTSRVTDLSTGVTVVGPDTETIKYTSVNMQQNLEQGVTSLARRMARELRRLIRTP